MTELKIDRIITDTVIVDDEDSGLCSPDCEHFIIRCPHSLPCAAIFCTPTPKGECVATCYRDGQHLLRPDNSDDYERIRAVLVEYKASSAAWRHKSSAWQSRPRESRVRGEGLLDSRPMHPTKPTENIKDIKYRRCEACLNDGIATVLERGAELVLLPEDTTETSGRLS